MFTDIAIFTYIGPVKRNVQILNGSKVSGKYFGFIIIKIPKETSLYHFVHHTTCHKTHKRQKVKLASNIIADLEASDLRP